VHTDRTDDTLTPYHNDRGWDIKRFGIVDGIDIYSRGLKGCYGVTPFERVSFRGGFGDGDVSCLLGESINFSKENGSLQSYFSVPPIPNLNFILVGKGEPGPDCGQIIASFICDNPDCGKVHYSINHCDRKECPLCYTRWLAGETSSIVERILSEEALKKHQGKRLVHIIVSINEEDYPVTHKELNVVIRDVYKYVKSKGVLGGVMIIHPFRATEEAKKKAREAGKKTWQWIREQERPEIYYRYSPHFHLICYIDWLEPPEAGEKFVYKTKTEDGHVINLLDKGEKEVKALIGYLLSHTGALEDDDGILHSERWFGSCSYNQLKVEKEEEGYEGELHCKECGGRLVGLWEWYRRWFEAVRYHDIDEPKYWNEIRWALFGEGPGPPEEEKKKYLI